MNALYTAVLAGIFLIGLLAWRQAVVGALVLAVFEGALRKWVFPEAHQWVYLGKDALLLGAYAGFFAPRLAMRRRLVSHPATVPLIALGCLTLVQLVNPALPNLWVGLFGIRAYMIYVPLLYLVPFVFRDAESLRKFWNRYLVLAAIPLVLGPIQFAAPLDSVLNRYAWQDEAALSVAALPGYGPRITSTFSYMSGYTTYLRVLFLVGLSTLLFDPKVPARWYRWAMLGGVIANSWMTGARGIFLLLGVAVLILMLLIVKLQGRRAVRSVVLMCTALPLLALLAERVFPEAYQGFVERARQSQDIPGRVTGIVTGPIWAIGQAGLFGYGVGSTHQATAFLAPGGSPAPPAEGELERIVLELGPLGLVFILWARILVTVRLWRAVKASRGTGLWPYLIGAFLYDLMSLPGPLIFNHTAHLFYWFMAGMTLIPVTRSRLTNPHLPQEKGQA